MKQLLSFCEFERAWLRHTVERLVVLESPTSDRLGAVGDGAHAAREHVLIDLIDARAGRAALLADPVQRLGC